MSTRSLFGSQTRLLAIAAMAVPLTLARAYYQAVPQVAADESAAPPRDAVVLFDGKDTSGWVHPGSNKPCQWEVRDGYMEVRGGNIVTKREFTDFQLHVEFWLPLLPENVKGQARANSGVYMQGRYEIQVLDSYGLKLAKGDCGALYGQKIPDINACLPPERWQTFDILFHAPRFGADGNVTAKPRISVLHNGLWIHENVEIDGRTTASMDTDPKTPGPIMVQDHGNKVRYRNIWLRPLKNSQA